MRNVICTTCRRTYGKKLLDFSPNVCHRCKDKEKEMKNRIGSYYARPVFRKGPTVNATPKRTYYPPPEDPLGPLLLPLIQEQMSRNVSTPDPEPTPSFVGGGGDFGGGGASASWDSPSSSESSSSYESSSSSSDSSFSDTPDSSSSGS